MVLGRRAAVGLYALARPGNSRAFVSSAGISDGVLSIAQGTPFHRALRYVTFRRLRKGRDTDGWAPQHVHSLESGCHIKGSAVLGLGSVGVAILAVSLLALGLLLLL